MQTVDLGKSGIQTSRLAIGTGSNGWNYKSDQTALGLKGLADLFIYAHDCGIRFWDSADQYGSHPHMKEALKSLDRQSITITSKTTSRTAKTVINDVKRFLKEIGTDYVDIVLLHCLTNQDWVDRYPEAMEALTRCKEKGLIRAHGVSCHDFGAFQTAAFCEWVEIVLARINYAGVSMDASPPDVVRVMEHMAHTGKGIYGMKVLGMGKLTREEAGTRQAIEFVMGLDCVHAMTIGMTNRQQVDENLTIMNEFLTT